MGSRAWSSILILAVGLVLLASLGLHAQGDAAAGKVLFDQKCASCHTVTADMAHGLLGPNLAGVVGRPAGMIMGWDFSAALKTANLTWTDENLNKWLTDTTALVPGTQMDLRVPSRVEREDVIAYLKTLKTK
jgi:cytochrome c